MNEGSTIPTYKRVLATGARLIIAVVFVWAAYGKLVDMPAFAESITNYQLLPEVLVGPLAALVPTLEIVIALGLITGLHDRGAALLAGGLLLVFSIAIAQAILRDIDIACGCFGKQTSASAGWGSILRNVGLILLAMYAAFGPPPLGGSRKQPDEAAPAE